MKRLLKNILFKSIICCAIILSIVQSQFINAYAADDINFINDEYSEYIRLEANKNTSILPEQVERKLNLQGVFDSELLKLDSISINEIINATDLQVVTEFIESTYSIAENSKAMDCCERVLSLRDINQLVRDGYIGNSVAKSATVTQDKKSNNNGIMKKTLIVTKNSTNDSKCAHIKLICTWLKMPKERYKDVVSVAYTDYANYYTDVNLTVSKQISYDYTKIYQNPATTDEIISTETKYMNTQNMPLLVESRGNYSGKGFETVYFQFPMPKDRVEQIGTSPKCYKYECTNCTVIIGFFVKVAKTHTLNIYGNYVHYVKEPTNIVSAVVDIACIIFGIYSTVTGNGVVLTVLSAGSTGYSIYNVYSDSRRTKLIGRSIGESLKITIAIGV